VTWGVNYLNRPTVKTDAGKTGAETDTILSHLECGEVANFIQFIESFYKMYDEVFGLVQFINLILKKHPEINCDSREQLEKHRERIAKIIKETRDYFLSDE
jgi:hypothetical protein